MELLFTSNPIFTDTHVSLSPVSYCDHPLRHTLPGVSLAGLFHYIQQCLFLNRGSTSISC